ncbi:uncharacterized protein CELE_F56C9.8 [Caenorhabditis elegans]|uniref:Secreted protein n=1 Tax=Caenorhabditis elegans TaxID=6239 RepID=Q20866_CAEEL|nr:Secreted protein [Caenorhabditis elegans]CCD61838.1 Secreted protein [Caenorhabditis elegans]|eukprot:NP_498613.2 Uncharacterized protein CELE_F56C9.8 [Caenorhabditis elegans]
MSYNHNQYNYQIAVVFAIVIGGVLLLAAFIYVIYAAVVRSMRSDDKQRLHSGRNSAQWNQPQQQYREQQPASDFPYNPAPTQNYDYNAPIRTPVNPTSFTPVPSVTQYSTQPQQYSNVPLVTPTTQQYIQNQSIPQYAPDVIYTQGPTGYIQQQPIEYNVQRQSPGANFVQSSV